MSNYTKIDASEITVTKENGSITFDPLSKTDGDWLNIKTDGIMDVEFKMSVMSNNYLDALKFINVKLENIIKKERRKMKKERDE